MKRWVISDSPTPDSVDAVVMALLSNRGFHTPVDAAPFLTPVTPMTLTASDVGIDESSLAAAVERIRRAIAKKESVIVYADYDADGVTAGAVMWEALYALGAKVMPYIPHRVEEGYGLSEKGIDSVIADYGATLIVTVDHGISAATKVAYAKSLGVDVIVTDHHSKPEVVPDAVTVHTTQLAGAGVAWFVAKTILGEEKRELAEELLSIAAIGTIADMVPLTYANRRIASYGLAGMNATKRVGLAALFVDAGLEKGNIVASDVSHCMAPRLNAMGRLDHALDALRLLCTRNPVRAAELAGKLGFTNKERQKLTMDMTGHASDIASRIVAGGEAKLLFIADPGYNPGIIGLVAGRLVEEYYLPSIVLARGEDVCKASARSVAGFNIIDAIRNCSDLLVDFGGHPMAAGFTVKTENLAALEERLRDIAGQGLTADLLTRSLTVDMRLPYGLIGDDLLGRIADFAPYGLANPEPVFATEAVTLIDARPVGKDNKHLKIRVSGGTGKQFDAIGFGLGGRYADLRAGSPIDIAYTLDRNEWNGKSSLQLKLKDIRA